MSINLETVYETHVLERFDLTQNRFSFLEPNEYYPERMVSHMQLAEPGCFVSVGTERIFFACALDPNNLCQGMVVRDIDPKVKAYNDFNVLLLRISDSREEYVKLSTKPDYMNDSFYYHKTQLLKERIPLIRDKLIASNMSEKMKAYYLEHLEEFALIYFNTNQLWRTIIKDKFEGCRYDLVDTLFTRVQKLAREGNIISTVGCINNLGFLGDRKITLMDTSNIADTTPINPEFGTFCTPRLIRTTGIPFANFTSMKFTPLNPIDRERFASFWAQLGESAGWVNDMMKTRNPWVSQYTDDAWALASPATLQCLEEFLNS